MLKNIIKKEQEIKLSKIIHLLGEILGLIVKEQEGISYFNKVEKIRILSKASRDKRNKKKITKSFRQLKSNIYVMFQSCSTISANVLVLKSSFNIHNQTYSFISVH